MREGVTYKRLGDLATFVNGYAFKPETWSDSGIPIIRIQNLNNPDAAFNYYDGEIPSKYVVEEGDLLISWSASLGAYFWNREKAYLNQHIFKVVFDKGDINKSYLKYAVEAQLEDMKRKAHGGTMQHIVKKDFDATPIPVPSLSTQELIVRELDSISSVISAKKQQVLELDNLAQAIFLDTFGDPITNPKGLEVKKIEEIATFINGKAHEQEIDENGKYILINSKYISSDAEIFKRTNSQNEPLYKNDIVMVMSDVPNGKALSKCMIIDEDDKFTLNQRICAFRNYSANPKYLLFSLNRNQYYLNFDDGDSQTNLRKGDVLECPIMCPPLSLQQAFAEKVQAIEEQKRLINQSIAEFESLLAQRMEFHFA